MERERGKKEKSLEIDETAAPPSVQRRYNCGVEENRRGKADRKEIRFIRKEPSRSHPLFRALSHSPLSCGEG